jgi:hypothetical protein
MLWGLLAAAAPVLIHFVNRMRHRPMMWGAMFFLARARRSSTKFAKLRRFLILACRVLALAMVAMLLARPLLGGFMGRLFAGPPELVVIVLDRSASMETRVGDGAETLRQRALAELVASRSVLQEVRRVVVLDSATRKPVELPSPEQLGDYRFWPPTDTGADVPALLDAALSLVAESKAGRSEIWVVSDLQVSNWRPSANRWRVLAERYASLPQDVTFRMVAVQGGQQANASIRVLDSEMRFDEGSQMLDLAFEIRAPGTVSREVVVSLSLNGRLQNLKLQVADGHLVVRRSFPLPDRESGWGTVEIPADGNVRDNRAFFAWEPPGRKHVVVVAEDPFVTRILPFAAAPRPDDPERVAEVRAPGQLGDLSQVSLLLWQGQPPIDGDREAVEAFLRDGGHALFLPGWQGGGEMVAGMGWGKPNEAKEDAPWRVTSWNQEDGPLAATASGTQLSVDRLQLFRTCELLGTPEEQYALLADETPFLAATAVGRGRAWFCPTLPQREWSTLGRGTVLLPMVQRLLHDAARRFGHIRVHECGEEVPIVDLVPLGEATAEAGTTTAGVFRADGGMVVLERPADEDAPGHLAEAEVRELFGEIPLQLQLNRQGAKRAGVQTELWWTMALLGLLFMLGEALLTMPPPRSHGEKAQ